MNNFQLGYKWGLENKPGLDCSPFNRLTGLYSYLRPESNETVASEWDSEWEREKGNWSTFVVESDSDSEGTRAPPIRIERDFVIFFFSNTCTCLWFNYKQVQWLLSSHECSRWRNREPLHTIADASNFKHRPELCLARSSNFACLKQSAIWFC